MEGKALCCPSILEILNTSIQSSLYLPSCRLPSGFWKFVLLQRFLDLLHLSRSLSLVTEQNTENWDLGLDDLVTGSRYSIRLSSNLVDFAYALSQSHYMIAWLHVCVTALLHDCSDA